MDDIDSARMAVDMTASHSSLLHLSTSEASLKFLHQERSSSQTSLSSQIETASYIKTEEPPHESEPEPPAPSRPPEAVPDASKVVEDSAGSAQQDDSGGMVTPDEGPPSRTESNPSLSDVPLKATTFQHLNLKYLGELEYMLREFQKLERQLLGAKTMQTTESSGSRERREKLHSFILHLEDTIQQIRSGCELEASGKLTVDGSLESTGLAKRTQEKEEEENVQKLEEHILANLLPVKVRLKKQLAAQQGAKHNPAGMPVRGVVADASKENPGTFMAAAAAQQRTTQFGKPLSGEGSTLTQKLHGATLGSETRVHGDGVGTSTDEDPASPKSKQILYAGMALGSDQMESSLTAASTVHRVVVHDTELLDMNSRKRSLHQISQKETAVLPASSTTDAEESHSEAQKLAPPKPEAMQPERVLSHRPSTATAGKATTAAKVNASAATATTTAIPQNPALSQEERRRLRKKRRKKKRMLREQQKQAQLQQQSSGSVKRKKTAPGGCKKRGPRAVEYMCSLCNEVYSYTCDYNPWWSLSQHECPKCRKTQVSYPSFAMWDRE
jgi:hypothetical protein